MRTGVSGKLARCLLSISAVASLCVLAQPPRAVFDSVHQIPIQNLGNVEAEIEITSYWGLPGGEFNAETASPAETKQITLAKGERTSYRTPMGASPMMKWYQTKPKATPCRVINSGRVGSSIAVE